MLITRCAWHRRYYGSDRLVGVASWRGVRVELTDGICRACAARVRSDLGVALNGRSARRRRRHWMSGIALVALAVLAVILLTARPTHEMPLSAAAKTALIGGRSSAGVGPRPAVVLTTPSSGGRQMRKARVQDRGRTFQRAAFARSQRQVLQSP